MIKTKNRKSVKIYYWAIMFFITIAICFGFMEFIFARYYYTDANYVDKKFDPQLGWIYKEGNYSIKPPQSFKKHSIYINSYGIRNKNLDKSMKGNMKRIIVLGDSFTFASAVTNDDLFTSKLENILNHISHTKYEVINAGVEGYGTIQELLLMRRLNENPINGDIYILMIFTNDILDNLCLDYGNKTENLVQPLYKINSKNKLLLKRPPIDKIDNSSSFETAKNIKFKLRIFETIKIKIRSFLQTKPNLIKFITKYLGISVQFPKMPGLINGWYKKDVLEEGIPIMKEGIKEIRDEANAHYAKLFVILIPSPIQIYSESYGPLLKKTFPQNKMVEKWDDDKLVPQKVIKDICKEYHIPFLDLYPILKNKNNIELYIPLEGHFNTKGHAIVADSVAKFLRLYNY